MPNYVLSIDKAQTIDGANIVDESKFVFDLEYAGSVVSSSSKTIIAECDGFITSNGQIVYLKDLFYSGHPGSVRTSYTELLVMGGRSSSRLDEIEKVRFEDQATVMHTYTLTTGTHYLAGTSSGREAVAAGGSGVADRIQKTRFDDTVAAFNFTNRLSTDKRGLAGAASFGDAIFGGGVSFVSSIDKVSYDDSAFSILTNTLSVGTEYLAASSTRTEIAFVGGSISSGQSSKVEKLRYDDTAMALMTNSLATARTRHAGSGTIAEMMFAGSCTSSNNSNTEKLRYDDQIAAVAMNDLPNGADSLCAESNILDKCLFLGGSPGPQSTIQSMHFDDSVQSVHTNSLSKTKFGTASAAGY